VVDVLLDARREFLPQARVAAPDLKDDSSLKKILRETEQAIGELERALPLPSAG
jgi:hypothetical protein